MTSSALIPLTDLSEFPSLEIPAWVREYQRAAELGLPLIPKYILLPDFIQTLEHKQLPAIKLLLTAYQRRLHGDFVTVHTLTTAPANLHASTNQIAVNVRGDNNLLESILFISKIPKVGAFSPVVIFQTPQATSSGLAWSYNPKTGSKTQLMISAYLGSWTPSLQVQPDTIIVDTRTQAIISTEKSIDSQVGIREDDGFSLKKSSAHQRKTLAISPAVAQQLANLTLTLKRQYLDQIQLTWFQIGNQVLIESWHVESRLDQPTIASSTSPTQTNGLVILGKGTPISAGIVQGEATCILAGSTSKNAHLPAGHILVADKLTSLHRPLLKQASAVVTELAISDAQALQLVQEFHIPTLTGIPAITKRVSTGQQLVVNTSEASVYLVPQMPTISASESEWINVIADVGAITPHQVPTLTGTSGVLLNAETPLNLLGYHPYFLLSHNPTLFEQHLTHYLKKMSSLHTDLWVKLAAPQTDQLLQLSYASNYDTPERNPFLGLHGAARLLQYPDLLKLQLVAIDKARRFVHKPLQIVVPFVRSVSEVIVLLQQWSHFTQAHSTDAQLWIELCTPASMEQIETYLKPSLRGLIVNLDILHALAAGVDPQTPDVTHHYPLDVQLLKTYFLHWPSDLSQRIPIYLLTSYYHPHLIEYAVHWKVTGLICRPTSIHKVRSEIHAVEQRLLDHGSH